MWFLFLYYMVMLYSPWIQTTYKCNLQCEYCNIRGTQDMSKKVYDKLSTFLTKENHIRIGGGEPLLVFDNWKEWATQFNTVEVLSNFQIIPKDYYNYNFRTSISIDDFGYKQLSSSIIKNIKKLKTQPWIMTTFINQDLIRLAEYVSKNNYGWAISTDYFAKNINLKNMIIQIKKIIEILRKNNYNFNDLIFNNISKRDIQGCGAGKEMITIDTNGDIYRCQTELNKKNKIGDIWNGYKEYECSNKNKCKDCIINNYCTGWCPLHHIPDNDICKLMKYFVWEVFYAE